MKSVKCCAINPTLLLLLLAGVDVEYIHTIEKCSFQIQDILHYKLRISEHYLNRDVVNFWLNIYASLQCVGIVLIVLNFK